MIVVPTWDLFIIVLFIIVTAYSFVVRASGTAKMILSSYVAILAADGLGNVIFQHFAGPNPTFKMFSFASSPQTVIAFKVFCFIVLVLFLAIKGSFDSNLAEDTGGFLGVAITGILGFLNAGLLVSILLVYLSGGSFLLGIGSTSSDLALNMYQHSQAARIMIDYASLWFSFPAIAFILSSVLTGE